MEMIIIAAVALGIGIGIGALARDFIRTARQESAYSRHFGEEVDEFLARFRRVSGVKVGVIEDFPEPPAERWWTDLPAAGNDQDGEPDGEPWPDEDEYPRDQTRVDHGAARLPFQPRGDADLGGWYINPAYPELAADVRAGPGAHRAEPEPEQHQTRDLSAFVGVAAPPGVVA